MRYVGRFLILGLSVFSLACTQATPEFEQLDPNNIPQPKFNGATTTTVTVTSTGNPVGVISGECNPKIRSISARAVNVVTAFSDLASITSTSSVTCSSDGKFTLTLKSLTDLGFSPLTLENTYEVQLKGFTSAGLSPASSIFIRYTSSLGNPYIRFAGGGVHGAGDATIATGGGVRAELRVNHMTLATPGTGGFPTDGAAIVMRPAGFSR